MSISHSTIQTSCGPVVIHSDETLLSVEPKRIIKPRKRIPPWRALLEAGRVNDVSKLGVKGLLAAVRSSENTDPELNRYNRVWVRDAAEATWPILAYYPELCTNISAYFLSFIADHKDDAKLSERGKVANHLRPATDPLAIELTAKHGRGWP